VKAINPRYLPIRERLGVFMEFAFPWCCKWTYFKAA